MTSWILLRGLTREAAHWGTFTGQLAARLGAGHRVLALDLPGNGVFYQRTSPHNVPALADACRAELHRLGVPPPYVLVAMSLGAMVAVRWCHDAPEEVAAGVLINTSLRGHSPFWQRLRPAAYARLFRIAWPGRRALDREIDVLGLTSSEPARYGAVPAQWAGIAIARPVSWRNTLRQLLAAARYAAPKARPPAPLLLLASAGDRLVSPRCSINIAGHWDVPLRVHPEAGHDLPLDDPHWLIDQIGDWWQARENNPECDKV